MNNNSTWIWSSLSKPMAFCLVRRNEILDFCEGVGIKTLYFSVYGDASMLDEMTKKIKRTIDDIHGRGMKIHALIGDYELCKAENHSKLLEIIDKVLQYNFDGLNLDVEPYVLKDTNGKSLMEDPTQAIHKQFLDMLNKAYAKIKTASRRIQFGPCIPCWYDTSTTKYCVSVAWNGTTKTLYGHLISLCDYVSLMDYVTNPDTAISMAKNEMEKASPLGKKVVIGLNLNTSEGSGNYYDPVDPSAGVKRMEDDMVYIEERCKVYPSYDGMAVHHLEQYMNYR